MKKIAPVLLAIAAFGSVALAASVASAQTVPTPTIIPIEITSSEMNIGTSTTVYVLSNPADQDICYVVMGNGSLAISCVKQSPAQQQLAIPSTAGTHG